MLRQKSFFHGLALASLAAPTLVLADSGLYLGASFGASHFEDSFTGVSLGADANAYRFTGGVQFGDFLGVEAGYLDFGDLSETIDLGGVTSTTVIDAAGWTLGGTLGLPLGGQLSLFGRAGVFFWDADLVVDGFSIDVPADENPYYGGGARVEVTRNLSLVGDWTRYELDTIDSDVISLGFTYRF